MRVVVCVLSLLLFVVFAPAADASVSCARWAAPGGSDAAAGTGVSPWRTVQRLADGLRPGETGCLAGGVYVDGGREYVARITHGGVMLRSAPGEHATIRGIVWVVSGANGVTLSDLTLDGRASSGVPAASPQIMAADTILERDEITNGGTAICAILGNTDGYGRAVRTIVRHNRFHDCGSAAHGMHDHSIYVEAADGARILGNTFTRSSAFAVQLYPDAQNTLVSRNVMYGNGGGVIFAGEGRLASSGNRVERNVIAGSTVRPGISAWWGGTVGSGNVARYNCLGGNRYGDVEQGGEFRSVGNVSRDPGFVDVAADDFRLSADSPCRALFGAVDAG